MAENNGKDPKPRILGLDGRVIRSPNDKDGDYATVGDLREVVDYFTAQISRAQNALAIQQRALIQMDNATLAGRWRRLNAWAELRWEWVRGWLIDHKLMGPKVVPTRPPKP